MSICEKTQIPELSFDKIRIEYKVRFDDEIHNHFTYLSKISRVTKKALIIKRKGKNRTQFLTSKNCIAVRVVESSENKKVGNWIEGAAFVEDLFDEYELKLEHLL